MESFLVGTEGGTGLSFIYINLSLKHIIESFSLTLEFVLRASLLIGINWWCLCSRSLRVRLGHLGPPWIWSLFLKMYLCGLGWSRFSTALCRIGFMILAFEDI